MERADPRSLAGVLTESFYDVQGTHPRIRSAVEAFAKRERAYFQPLPYVSGDELYVRIAECSQRIVAYWYDARDEFADLSQLALFDGVAGCVFTMLDGRCGIEMCVFPGQESIYTGDDTEWPQEIIGDQLHGVTSISVDDLRRSRNLDTPDTVDNA